MSFRLLSREDQIAIATGAVDEAIARETYDLSVDIVLKSPALLKISESVTTGTIKFTYAGKKATVTTMNVLDVNGSNIYVQKIFKTGTTLTTTQFYLYQ